MERPKRRKRTLTTTGAGKFLGVRRNFARILPNLPEKYFKKSDLQKNQFERYNFLNQNMSGAVFAQSFRRFLKILPRF